MDQEPLFLSSCIQHREGNIPHGHHHEETIVTLSVTRLVFTATPSPGHFPLTLLPKVPLAQAQEERGWGLHEESVRKKLTIQQVWRAASKDLFKKQMW